jgi:predicted transcriptional regulator
MAVDHYTRIMGDIQALFRSRLQIQILLALADGNKTLAQLREITGSSSQALIPKIRKLESSNYIAISEYEYHLRPVGKILTLKIQDIILFKSVTRKHKDFWDQHKVDAIPDPFLHNLGDLFESEIISDTNVDIFNVYFNFLKALNEAERVCIVSPISSPAHTEAVAKRALEGVTIELLVGKDLAAQFSLPPYVEKIAEVAGTAKGKIFILDPMPKLGLTVTDKVISLGLYKLDGVTYDSTTDLFSKNEQAVGWGQRLFDYYRDQSVELKF